MPTDPAHGSNANDPTSAKAHLTPVEFWYMHKTKILLYGGVLVLALILFSVWQVVSYVRTTNAEALYAKAEKPADFQAIIQQYSNTPVAGNAALSLGEAFRTEGKYSEAVAVLKQFVKGYPTHPLACGGWTSLGITFEKQGNLDEALDAYTTAITKYPDAYTTPLAMMAQARIFLAKGKKSEARSIYTDVMARFPKTLHEQEARRNLKFMTK